MKAVLIESRGRQMALPLANTALRGLTPEQREETLVLLAQLLLETAGRTEASDEDA
jgi:hypothetical protein